MKAPHLLRVTLPPADCAPLFEAAAALKLALGWLEFPEGPQPAPPSLADAAAQGARRAVAVGEGGSITLKPRKGKPVLRDLLRESFLGCTAVLIAGEPPTAEPIPTLEPHGEGWKVGPQIFTSEELAQALRKPHPFS